MAALIHQEYSILFPSLPSICVALCAKNELARIRILLTERKGIRLVGTHVSDSKDPENPAFLLPGASAVN